MPPNNKDYMKNYMKQYTINHSYDVECDLCNVHLKKYNMYAHKKTKKHQQIERKVNERLLANAVIP
jgi:hypothetical protein